MLFNDAETQEGMSVHYKAHRCVHIDMKVTQIKTAAFCNTFLGHVSMSTIPSVCSLSPYIPQTKPDLIGSYTVS